LSPFWAALQHGPTKMKAKKSWRDKLADDKGLPKVCEVTGKLTRRWGEGRFVIPAPREVDALMKQVPKGRVATINELRAALAKKHKADFACPITTGIFSWIAAHAAAEAEAEGGKRITPYWRTLKTGGEINPKYPGGVVDIAKRLRAEGHKVMSKGKRVLVADYEAKLFAKLR
jgi:alkylated DNA nucleotide flippase Atl1